MKKILFVLILLALAVTTVQARNLGVLSTVNHSRPNGNYTMRDSTGANSISTATMLIPDGATIFGVAVTFRSRGFTTNTDSMRLWCRGIDSDTLTGSTTVPGLALVPLFATSTSLATTIDWTTNVTYRSDTLWTPPVSGWTQFVWWNGTEAGDSCEAMVVFTYRSSSVRQ